MVHFNLHGDYWACLEQAGLNVLMESKGGKKKSSSSKSLFYEAPLGYSIEDIRPNGGIKKFRSAAYSNCARKPS
ncbi:S-adenosylmethionine decarboxylase proenzyme 3 [Citrus sinensis]|uniref:S-adenosylmethionine decarboxylase proenzyme 3 n=1 Tax=Citrus sinensis TaxID=2711 RepID=A0ACB8LF86_CITSI|nr:S-adenosylmethionine decarboxylase proenzyme 3 [Citrus sinensis]KAH9772107.1 S-adenosylmethionine decarboxylase proenzyme 3 [Citrus sinensis]